MCTVCNNVCLNSEIKVREKLREKEEKLKKKEEEKQAKASQNPAGAGASKK